MIRDSCADTLHQDRKRCGAGGVPATRMLLKLALKRDAPVFRGRFTPFLADELFSDDFMGICLAAVHNTHSKVVYSRMVRALPDLCPMAQCRFTATPHRSVCWNSKIRKV